MTDEGVLQELVLTLDFIQKREVFHYGLLTTLNQKRNQCHNWSVYFNICSKFEQNVNWNFIETIFKNFSYSGASRISRYELAELVSEKLHLARKFLTM